MATQKDLQAHKLEPAAPSGGFLTSVFQLKELIGAVVVIGGAIAWIGGYFATRQQLSEFKCFATTSLIAQQESFRAKQAEQDIQRLTRQLDQLFEKKNKKILDSSDGAELRRLELDIKNIERVMVTAQTEAAAAEKKLKFQNCNGD
ncbi:hypothetical protein [Roseateles sp. YR242]|uniref:hypothetical protein n=1 Tax=Roseateles sp. YR242 TaxID=1855305 RepID=UPI000B8456E7|nr:hypothetical protein [Roseateles sp. YR242]